MLQKTLSEKDEQLSHQSKQLSNKDAQLSQQQVMIDALLEQLKLSRHRQFGKQSERHTDDAQGCLFDEAALIGDQSEIEAAY